MFDRRFEAFHRRGIENFWRAPQSSGAVAPQEKFPLQPPMETYLDTFLNNVFPFDQNGAKLPSRPQLAVRSARNGVWGSRMGRPPHETTDLTPFYAENRRLRPPDHLGDLQRRAFLDLVTSCPISQFPKSDLALLCRWAELSVMAETAAFHLGADGMVITGKEGPKVSPWFTIHRDATRELRALSQRLQLGPRGRTPKAPKTVAGSVSYYER